MKVLVQYDAMGTQALGLWWVNPISKQPEDLYLDPESPQAARGRMIVHGKTNKNMPWEQWFDLLTTRAPYTEDWAVYDSMGFQPDQMLRALQPSEPVAS